MQKSSRLGILVILQSLRNTSSEISSFHGVRRLHASFQRREVTDNIQPTMAVEHVKEIRNGITLQV